MKQIKMEHSKAIEKDIQSYGNEIAKQIAIKAREEFTNEYQNAIEKFYSEYTPKEYVRQWQLYNSGNKFYRNSHGNIYYGGVRISPDNMKDVHQEENEIVLWNSVADGLHGYVAQYTPTALDHIFMFRDLVLANMKYWSRSCIEKAKRTRNYTYLFK